MRPVLVELGPWPLWAIPLLALAFFGFLWVWSRVDQEVGASARVTTAQYALRIALALITSVAIYYLVNRFGPVPIRSYGVMLLVAIMVGLVWICHTGRPHGLEPWMLVDFALFLLLGGILGARLLFVLLNWPQFSEAPLHVFRVWEGGLSFHGGLAGGLAGGYVFARLRRIPFSLLADLGAPATALGYAFAKIGCFLNGCCFGHEVHGYWQFWGIRFAPGSWAATWSLDLPPGQAATTWGQPLYPAQLFSSFLSLIVFYLLVRLRPYVPKRGHLFIVFLALYGVQRFIVEFWRYGATAKPFPYLPALTEAQVASIALILGSALYLWLTWPRQAEDKQRAPVGGSTQDALEDERK